eukprot:TRINITY_DN9483_c0_g2_i1.p1 TRINITY_DN9483_c0_g2~~TRINITY_DN9483_c0_g2_i1.p1  ORF type:complete len:633 (+),score=63.11 TRINITY_DN9483_c0_g2_i1:83-1981(+)
MWCVAAVDLRFAPDEERAYRCANEPGLLSRSQVLFLVYIFFGVIGFAHTLWTTEFEWRHNPRITSIAVELFLASSYVLLAWIRRRTDLLKSLDLEVLVVIIVGCALIHLQVTRVYSVGLAQNDGDSSFLALLSGQEWAILRMMTMLSSCQAMLPIRSCYFAVLPVVAIMGHLVASALCGWEIGRAESVAMLSVMCASCTTASYRQDREAREKWCISSKVEKQQGVIVTLEKATNDVLDHFCDCVFHVDRDATIVAADPRFPASLLLNGVERVLGRSINDFLASDGDVARFAEMIRSLSARASGLGMLSVRLRDAIGRSFQAHAHVSRYHGDAGDIGFLVGLAEMQERQMAPSVAPPMAQNLSLSDSKRSRSESDLSERSSALSDLRPAEADDAEVCFYADRRLTIKSMSTGFTELSGPLQANSSLLDLVLDGNTFSHWVDKVRAICLDNMRFKNSFVLRTPHSASVQTEFVVEQCDLEEVSFEHASDTHRKKVCMRLKLGSLRPRKFQKPKTPLYSRKHRRSNSFTAGPSNNWRLEPTLEEAYESNLMRFLSRTYSPLDDFDCCPLHAAVKTLRLHANRLDMKHCGKLWEKATGQCKNCGFVCHAADDMSAGCYECDWCGNDVLKFPDSINL